MDDGSRFFCSILVLVDNKLSLYRRGFFIWKRKRVRGRKCLFVECVMTGMYDGKSSVKIQGPASGVASPLVSSAA